MFKYMFRSVVFNIEKVSRRELGLYCEMSSFPETKAERLMFGVNGDPAMFLWFHRYGSLIYLWFNRDGSAILLWFHRYGSSTFF